MKKKCVKCFKNLSIESRAKIYMMLSKSKKIESEITKIIGLKQPTVSYHLTAMVKSGLLSVESVGNKKYFSASSRCPHDKTRCIVSSK